MRKIVVVLLFALVAAPALAGCLGGDDKTKPGDGEETCGAQCEHRDPTAGTGGIRGQILDDTLVPLEGANVTLRELELSTKTTADGRFSFVDLAPGAYTVYAQNPPTHRANGKQVQVAADGVIQVDMILELLPPPAEPYMAEWPFHGIMGCTFAQEPFSPTDFCTMAKERLGASQPEYENTFEFFLDKGTNAIAVKLDSAQGPLGKAALHMSWSIPVDSIPELRGQTPLTATYEFTPDVRFTQTNDTATFTILGDGEQGTPQIVYEQQVDIYITVFYNGMKVPDGYTAGPA